MEIFCGEISSDELSFILIYDCLKGVPIDLPSTETALLIDVVKAPHTESMTALKLHGVRHNIEANWAAAVDF